MTPSVSSCRVLLVDQSTERAEALERLLRNIGYPEVRVCDLGSDLLDEVQQFRPDVVLLEIDNPRRDMLEQLSLLQDQRPTAVAVFCQDAQTQSIRDAVESGVCAYVVEGIHPEQVRPAITLAMSTFGAFTRLKEEAATAKKQLDERRRVDRAKHLLIQQQGLTEEQAYQAIRKLAMDRQKKLSEAADDLIAMLKIVNGGNA